VCEYVFVFVLGAGFSSLGSALALNYSRLSLRYEFESRVGRLCAKASVDRQISLFVCPWRWSVALLPHIGAIWRNAVGVLSWRLVRTDSSLTRGNNYRSFVSALGKLDHWRSVLIPWTTRCVLVWKCLWSTLPNTLRGRRISSGVPVVVLRSGKQAEQMKLSDPLYKWTGL